jgi:hypothetical protein
VAVAFAFADGAALEAALSAAGALRVGAGQHERTIARGLAAPYRLADGSYRFRSRLRYVVAGRP